MSSDDRHPHARGLGMASERSRQRLIERLRDLGAGDERVLEAMARVPRHQLVDEAMASRAYDDTALPIGYGQTISQPFVVAHMTTLLLGEGEPPRTVLEIGTGSGYQAAVLAELVEKVYTVERIPALYRRARTRLRGLGYRNVRVRLADGTVGLPDYAPFDGILVTAGAESLPDTLLEQLADGGRLVAPIGAHGMQYLVVVERHGDEFSRRELDPVSFVPLLPGVEE
jgi:protein-L-isoaspartate(D-aspartate) O-methyltransferase